MAFRRVGQTGMDVELRRNCFGIHVSGVPSMLPSQGSQHFVRHAAQRCCLMEAFSRRSSSCEPGCALVY